MTALAFRPAEQGDADLLFDWVNRPDCLAGKLRTGGPIPRPVHDAWFAARLSDPDCRIWIVERGGLPAAQLRLQPADGGHEVDIYVVPEARQAGVAVAALRHAVEAMAAASPGATLIARVRRENAASKRLFASAGFVPRDSSGDHVLYDFTV